MKKLIIFISIFIVLSSILVFSGGCIDYSEYLEYTMTFKEKEGYDDSNQLIINAGDTREFVINDEYNNNKLNKNKLRYEIDNENNKYVLAGVYIEGNSLKVEDGALENIIMINVYYKDKIIFRADSSRTILININESKMQIKQEYFQKKEYIDAKYKDCVEYEFNASYYSEVLKEKEQLEKQKNNILDESIIEKINIKLENLEEVIKMFNDYLTENERYWKDNKDNYIREKNVALDLYYQYHAKPKDGQRDSYGLPN